MSSLFHQHKQETIDSFLRFTQGEEFPRWPMDVFLEVSNVCDLKCAMCATFSALNEHRYAKVAREERGFLDIQHGTEGVAPLLEHALQIHAFGYGEPTIHPKFVAFLSEIGRYEAMVDFFTNGMHMSDALCRTLVEQRVARMTISFSGANAADYESVYLGGDFERVLAGIRRLRDVKTAAGSRYPIIEVNSLAFRHHVESLVDFVRIMGEAGVNVVHLKPLVTMDDVPELHAHVAVPGPRELEILEQAREVAKQFDMILGSKPFERLVDESRGDMERARRLHYHGKAGMSEALVPVAEFPALAKSRKVPVSERQTVERRIGAELMNPDDPWIPFPNGEPCLEPFYGFYLGYNGDSYPCCFRNRKYALGVVPDEDGLSIWRGERFQSVREHIATSRSYPKQMCGSCLKARPFPPNHGLAHRVRQYRRWYQERYGVPFYPEVEQHLKNVPTNSQILARFAGHAAPGLGIRADSGL